MWRFPLSYLGYTSNGHFLKHICAGGGNVTFVVYIYSSRHIVMSVRLSRSLSNMTQHASS